MKVQLKNVRLSFPDLFIAKAFQQGDKPRFRATFLLEKESAQIKEIEEAILAVATAKWGTKAAAIVKSTRGSANRFCFQDGDTKEYDGYAGKMTLSANSKTRPLVVDRDKTPLSATDGRPYSGCYVNANIEFFAYDTPGNGISAALKGVQFLRDGDAFGGGAPPSVDDFEDLGVDEQNEADSLAG